ncbi:carbonic anhydrase [Desulfosporosinus sp. OT]|uniref:carbonic anhydrase n=1 Tax=Desulfosporosinus sp. OT TaxID=913865 RepID=UPI000223A895|nr:carbonic anhydrase [Desulfosporosinus sp. OT]EGW40538.1 carbonic anhydrase domain protein [Desulfosporosinus sp. OT]
MKKVITFIGVASLSLVLMLGGCGTKSVPTSSTPQSSTVDTPVYKRTEVITSSDVAKKLLDDGNARFTSGKTLNKDLSATRRMDLEKNGQHPFAVIVSCSDSRVPPEVLYDEALGDLFVIRVAGNVVTPVELGSVEYAVEHLKTPLIVVLGHEGCGAVTAAVQGGEIPGSIGSIVEKIKPAIDEAKTSGVTGNDLIEKSVDFNVQNAIQDILKSPIIKHAVDTKESKILGAKYDLDTGVSTWYNE